MRCVTLFAGAGGADLGLAEAGVEHLACVEVDADCCATLTAAGFPAVRAGVGGPYVVNRGKRTEETVPGFDAAPYVGADLVWASPPCQPYSRAGKGLGADDPRDGWPHTLDAVRLVRPRWVVVENVSGAPVEKWLNDLRAAGYVAESKTLDAASFGVPQNRVREFIVARLHPCLTASFAGGASAPTTGADTVGPTPHAGRFPTAFAPAARPSERTTTAEGAVGATAAPRVGRTAGREAPKIRRGSVGESSTAGAMSGFETQTTPVPSMGTFGNTSSLQSDCSAGPSSPARSSTTSTSCPQTTGPRTSWCSETTGFTGCTIGGGASPDSCTLRQLGFEWPRETHSLYALAEAKWRTGAYWHRHGIAPVGEPTRKEERTLGRLLDPGRGLLPWRTMRDALPGLVAPVWTSQTSERGDHREPIVRTQDEPAPTVRSQEGTGLETEHVTNQLLLFCKTSGAVSGYRDRQVVDASDQPAPALTAQAGKASPWFNAGVPFAVDPKHPLNDPDHPAGTIRSGGSGHGAPPVYVTTSREGRERIEYPLRNAPESVRGPSDLVRRHMLQSPDQPATTLATASPMYLRDEAVTRRASEPDRLDRPAPTVATTEEKGTRAHGNPPDFNGGPDRASDAAWLAVGRRRLTVEECAVLQDFPVGHPFQGTKTSRYRQVGNAVCPRVAEVIARAILTPTEAP